MSEMSCKTCGRWAAGWCLAQQLGTSRDEVCNAWELSRVVEWEDENEKLKSRIAKLEAAQRWIPVKEKLPNLFETVLIWAYCDCDGYDRFDLAFNSGLVWVGTQQDIEYEDVTHWMPLPTPPEVQE